MTVTELPVQVMRKGTRKWVSVTPTGQVSLPDGGIKVNLPGSFVARPGDRLRTVFRVATTP